MSKLHWLYRPFLILIIFLFGGCSISVERYIVNDAGEERLVERMEIDRGAKAEFPGGYKVEAEPLFKWPEFPPTALDVGD